MQDTRVWLLEKIDEQVERRAQAVRDHEDATREIASFCVTARAAGVVMRVLAEHVKVWDSDKEQLRSVTRQSVDGMIAELEGRERTPRKRAAPKDRPRGQKAEPQPAAKINRSAFGLPSD